MIYRTHPLSFYSQPVKLIIFSSFGSFFIYFSNPYHQTTFHPNKMVSPYLFWQFLLVQTFHSVNRCLVDLTCIIKVVFITLIWSYPWVNF